jgi:nitroreductase/dihydropteridine reductase
MLTTYAVIGVDASPMEGFINEKYNEILNLNERNLTAVVIANIGFRDEDGIFIKMKKVRWPQEDFIVRI